MVLEQFIKNPGTVKELAQEINRVSDAYWSRNITESALKEYMLYWASKHGDKLFMGSDLNPTVKKIIGKKRLSLVNIMLEGTQYSMFDK